MYSLYWEGYKNVSKMCMSLRSFARQVCFITDSDRTLELIADVSSKGCGESLRAPWCFDCALYVRFSRERIGGYLLSKSKCYVLNFIGLLGMFTDSSACCRRDDSYWNGNKKIQPESEGRMSQASDYSNRQQGRFSDFSSRDRTRFPDSTAVQPNNFERYTTNENFINNHLYPS